jgi:hypothetical protein
MTIDELRKLLASVGLELWIQDPGEDDLVVITKSKLVKLLDLHKGSTPKATALDELRLVFIPIYANGLTFQRITDFMSVVDLLKFLIVTREDGTQGIVISKGMEPIAEASLKHAIKFAADTERRGL